MLSCIYLVNFQSIRAAVQRLSTPLMWSRCAAAYEIRASASLLRENKMRSMQPCSLMPSSICQMQWNQPWSLDRHLKRQVLHSFPNYLLRFAGKFGINACLAALLKWAARIPTELLVGVTKRIICREYATRDLRQLPQSVGKPPTLHEMPGGAPNSPVRLAAKNQSGCSLSGTRRCTSSKMATLARG